MDKSATSFNIINPKRFPFFYGWVIILVGALGVLMSAPGQTIGVSAFTDSLLDALGLSRDQLSIAYMAGTMLSSVMLTKAGKFFDKFGAARTGLFASVGLAIALLYLSQIDKISNAISDNSLVPIIGIFIGFIFIRFFGQGVLTLTGRTMVVKWFDERRGLAIGILSMVTAYGFSIAPVVFDYLIRQGNWSTAWIKIAIVAGLIFPIIIIVFFKDGPEKYGLEPDGFSNKRISENKPIRFPVYKNHTLAEARRTLSLWVFSGLAAMFGLVVTAFSFHVVSFFAEQGFSRTEAINIFQPIAIVAIVATFFFSYISDFVRLKYIAILFGCTCLLTMYGMSNLSGSGINYWILIISYGCSSGIHVLIMTVFMPRFFGKQHLGAITGQAMTIVVFCSALGPILFSLSLSRTGTYQLGTMICAAIFLILLIASLFTYNPQTKLAPKNS